jgi:hypothetical protein
LRGISTWQGRQAFYKFRGEAQNDFHCNDRLTSKEREEVNTFMRNEAFDHLYDHPNKPFAEDMRKKLYVIEVECARKARDDHFKKLDKENGTNHYEIYGHKPDELFLHKEE